MPTSHFQSLTEQELHQLENEWQEKITAPPFVLDPDKISTEQIKTKIMNTPRQYKDFLYYINKESANDLANAAHPLLREWGVKCKDYYEKGENRGYLQIANGLFISSRGAISISWHLKEDRFIILPGCPNHEAYRVRLVLVSALPTKIQSLTPLHIAALMGDKSWVEELINQGHPSHQSLNQWDIVPLELAVLSGDVSTVHYFLTQHIHHADKALLLAIEKSNLAVINTFIDNSVLCDESIMIKAKERHPDFPTYLEQRMRYTIAKIATTDALRALQLLLNMSKPNADLVRELIYAYPDVLSKVDDNGDTILHWAVKIKKPEPARVLFGEMFKAQYNVENLKFDVELKNKNDKTILQLALDNKQKEMILLIMYHFLPNRDQSQAQTMQSLEINMEYVKQEHEHLRLEVEKKLSLTQNKANEILANSLQDIEFVAQKQESSEQAIYQLDQRQQHTERAADQLAQMTFYLQHLIKNIYEKLSLAVPQGIANWLQFPRLFALPNAANPPTANQIETRLDSALSELEEIKKNMQKEIKRINELEKTIHELQLELSPEKKLNVL